MMNDNDVDGAHPRDTSGDQRVVPPGDRLTNLSCFFTLSQGGD